jgi:single-strand DNA-binding protein
MHKTEFIGRLGKDVSLRYTPDGKAVASFSVAVDDGYGDKKMTIWYRVSAWDKLAENCNQYLHKGSKVYVDGRLIADKATGGPRLYKRQDGTDGASFEVSAGVVEFLDGKQQDAAPAGGDEDIPF